MSTDTGPVIVVDDDDAVRQSLKFVLEIEGLQVRAYCDGAQLLAEPNMPTQGCLIVDYNMPGMNGIELVEHLRTRHVDLPAILMTGRISDHIRRKAGKAGFNQVIEKPLQDDSLVETIRTALASKHLALRDIP